MIPAAYLTVKGFLQTAKCYDILAEISAMMKKIIKIKNILLIISVAFLIFFVIGCVRDKDYLSLDRDARHEFRRLNESLEAETVYEKKFIIMRQLKRV